MNTASTTPGTTVTQDMVDLTVVASASRNQRILPAPEGGGCSASYLRLIIVTAESGLELNTPYISTCC